jgi:hypothetical protein
VRRARFAADVGFNRSKDGGPEAITIRLLSGSTRNTTESSIATGNGPLLAQGSQASHVKSPWSRTSYANRRLTITPLVGAEFVTARAFREARCSNHEGVVAGALILTLGCTERRDALSRLARRPSPRVRATAPPATRRTARTTRLRFTPGA